MIDFMYVKKIKFLVPLSIFSCRLFPCAIKPFVRLLLFFLTKLDRKTELLSSQLALMLVRMPLRVCMLMCTARGITWTPELMPRFHVQAIHSPDMSLVVRKPVFGDCATTEDD